MQRVGVGTCPLSQPGHVPWAVGERLGDPQLGDEGERARDEPAAERIPDGAFGRTTLHHLVARTEAATSSVSVPRADPSGSVFLLVMAGQLTAFFTSAAMLASTSAVNSVRAKATGHMAPSSRFALSLKPNVAYLVLNFCAL
jgi:hypothetical protein